MKKFRPIFLSLTLLFFGLCISASAAEKIDCDDLFSQELADYLAHDHQQLLPNLYQLAALKMAMESTKENRSTVEEFSQKWKKNLLSQNENQLKKLEDLYQRYGIQEDIKTLSESFESASYWQSQLRFDNQDASAFILAHHLISPQSSFTKTDAAAVWLMNAVTQRSAKGSVLNNKLNFSGRVAHLTGAISRGRKWSAAEFEEEVMIQAKIVSHEMKEFTEHFLSAHANQCSQWWRFQTSCFGEDFALNFGIPEALLKLKDQATVVENLRIEQDLVIRFGSEIEFHLRPLARSEQQRKSTKVALLENEKIVKELDKRRQANEKLMSLVGHDERIKHFHLQFQKDDSIYGIIDRASEKIQFFSQSAELLASFSLIYPKKSSDRNQEGGAGMYHYSYTSALGQIFLSDHRGINIAYRVEQVKKVEEFLKKSSQVYVLPVEQGNYFKIKDDRFIFTTKNRHAHPEDYNFTPRRVEFRELKTVITEKNYRTDESLKFVATLDREKQKLMQLYGLENDDYNEIARMAFGILGNESKFASSLKYKIKEKVPFLVSLAKGEYFDTSSNSRGPTQIKNVPKLIAEHYKISKADLKDPEKAAVATLGFLAEAMNELRAKERFHPEITPENRFDYLHYLYMGRHNEIINGTATPEKNIYLRQLKSYAEGLEQFEG